MAENKTEPARERLTREELDKFHELQFQVEEAGNLLQKAQQALREHELTTRRAHKMRILDSWTAQGDIVRQ